MISKHFNTYRSWFKGVAIVLVCLFAINDFSFAFESLGKHDTNYTLSPCSPFRPLLSFEKVDNEFIIVEDKKLAENFREKVVLSYLSLLIGKVLDSCGSKVSPKALKDIIESDLSYIDFIKSVKENLSYKGITGFNGYALSHIEYTGFKWKELFKKGNTFCVPYIDEKDPSRSQILRYYISDDKSAAIYKGAVPVGTGDVRVICEPFGTKISAPILDDNEFSKPGHASESARGEDDIRKVVEILGSALCRNLSPNQVVEEFKGNTQIGRFDLIELEKAGNTYYLPFRSKPGGRQQLLCVSFPEKGLQNIFKLDDGAEIAFEIKSERKWLDLKIIRSLKQKVKSKRQEEKPDERLEDEKRIIAREYLRVLDIFAGVQIDQEDKETMVKKLTKKSRLRRTYGEAILRQLLFLSWGKIPEQIGFLSFTVIGIIFKTQWSYYLVAYLFVQTLSLLFREVGLTAAVVKYGEFIVSVEYYLYSRKYKKYPGLLPAVAAHEALHSYRMVWRDIDFKNEDFLIPAIQALILSNGNVDKMIEYLSEDEIWSGETVNELKEIFKAENMWYRICTIRDMPEMKYKGGSSHALFDDEHALYKRIWGINWAREAVEMIEDFGMLGALVFVRNLALSEQNVVLARNKTAKRVSDILQEAQKKAAMLPAGISEEYMRLIKDGYLTEAEELAQNSTEGTAERVKELNNKHVTKPPKLPPGSIPGVFKYLCDNNITSLNVALTGQQIANLLSKTDSYNTLKYDFRALCLHLHLIERDITEGKGKNARYFVPERVRNKADEILLVLFKFTGKNLRPKVEYLKQVYQEEILPILESISIPKEKQTTSHKGVLFHVKKQQISDKDLTLIVPTLLDKPIILKPSEKVIYPNFDRTSNTIIIPSMILKDLKLDKEATGTEKALFENKEFFIWIVNSLLSQEDISSGSIERISRALWYNRRSLLAGHLTFRQVIDICKPAYFKNRIHKVGSRNISTGSRIIFTWDEILLLLELADSPPVSTIYVDFDNTLFAPLTYAGSEEWFRDRILERDDFRSLKAEKANYETQLLEAGLITTTEEELAERLTSLQNKGVRIVGLTARDVLVQPQTQMILEHIGFRPDEIIYVSRTRWKYHILKKHLQKQKEKEEKRRSSLKEESVFIQQGYSVYIDDLIGHVIKTEKQCEELFSKYRLVSIAYQNKRDFTPQTFINKAREDIRCGYNKRAIIQLISALESIIVSSSKDMGKIVSLILSIDDSAEKLKSYGENISEVTISWIRCISSILKHYSPRDILSFKKEGQKTGEEMVKRFFKKLTLNPMTFYEYYKKGKITFSNVTTAGKDSFSYFNMEINENNIYCFMEPLLKYIETQNPDIIVLPDTGARPFKRILEYFIKERGLNTKVQLIPFSAKITADTAFELNRWLTIANKNQDELIDTEDREIHDSLCDFVKSKLKGKSAVILDDNISQGNTSLVLDRILRNQSGLKSTCEREELVTLVPFSSLSPEESKVPVLSTVSLPFSMYWKTKYFRRISPLVALPVWEKNYLKRGAKPRRRYSAPFIESFSQSSFLEEVLNNFKMDCEKYYKHFNIISFPLKKDGEKDIREEIDYIYKKVKPIPCSTKLPEVISLANGYELRRTKDIDRLKLYYQCYLKDESLLDEFLYPDFSIYEIRSGEDFAGIVEFLEVVNSEGKNCLVIKKISLKDLSSSRTEGILKEIFGKVISESKEQKYSMVLACTSISKSKPISTSHKIRRYLGSEYGSRPHLFGQLRLKETVEGPVDFVLDERVKKILAEIMGFKKIIKNMETFSLESKSFLLNLRFYEELAHRPNTIWCDLDAGEIKRLKEVKKFFVDGYPELIKYSYGPEKKIVRRWKDLFQSAGQGLPYVPISNSEYKLIEKVAKRAQKLLDTHWDKQGTVEENAIRLYEVSLQSSEEETETERVTAEEFDNKEAVEMEDISFPVKFFSGKLGKRRARAVILHVLKKFYPGHDLSGLKRKFFVEQGVAQALREGYGNNISMLIEDICPGNYRRINGDVIAEDILEITAKHIRTWLEGVNKYVIRPGQYYQSDFSALPEDFIEYLPEFSREEGKRFHFEFKETKNHGYICEILEVMDEKKELVEVIYFSEESKKSQRLRGDNKYCLNKDEWDILNFLLNKKVMVDDNGIDVLLKNREISKHGDALFYNFMGKPVVIRVPGTGKVGKGDIRLRLFKDPNHDVVLEASLNEEAKNYYFKDKKTGRIVNFYSGNTTRKFKDKEYRNLGALDMYSFLQKCEIEPQKDRDVIVITNGVIGDGVVSYPDAPTLRVCGKARVDELRGKIPVYKLITGPNAKTMLEISIDGKITNYYYQDDETKELRHFLEPTKSLKRGRLMTLPEFKIIEFLAGRDVTISKREVLKVEWPEKIAYDGKIKMPEVGRKRMCMGSKYTSRKPLYEGKNPVLGLVDNPNHGTMLLCYVSDEVSGKKKLTNFYYKNTKTGKIESWVTKYNSHPPSMAEFDIISFLNGKDIVPQKKGGRNKFQCMRTIFEGATFINGMEKACIGICAKKDKDKQGKQLVKFRLFSDVNHGTMLEVSIRNKKGRYEVTNLYFKDKKTGDIRSFRSLTRRTTDLITMAEFDIITFLNGKEIRKILPGRDVLKNANRIKHGGITTLAQVDRIKVCPRGQHLNEPVDFRLFNDVNHGIMLECSIKGKPYNYYYRDKTTGEIRHLRETAGLAFDPDRLLTEMDIVSFLKGEQIKPLKGRNQIELEANLYDEPRANFRGMRIYCCYQNIYSEKTTVRFKLVKDRNHGTMLKIYVKNHKGRYKLTNCYYKDKETGEIRQLITGFRRDVRTSLGKLDISSFLNGYDIEPLGKRGTITSGRGIDGSGSIYIRMWGDTRIQICRAGEHKGEKAGLRLFKYGKHGTMLECSVGKGKNREITNYYYKDKKTGEIKNLRKAAGMYSRLIGLTEFDVISYLKGEEIEVQLGREEFISIGDVRADGAVDLPMVHRICVYDRNEGEKYKGNKAKFRFFTDPNHGIMLECSINGDITNYYYHGDNPGEVCHFRGNLFSGRYKVRSLTEFDMLCYLAGKNIRIISERDYPITTQQKVKDGYLNFFYVRNIKAGNRYNGKQLDMRFFNHKEKGVIINCFVDKRKIGYLYHDQAKGAVFVKSKAGKTSDDRADSGLSKPLNPDEDPRVRKDKLIKRLNMLGETEITGGRRKFHINVDNEEDIAQDLIDTIFVQAFKEKRLGRKILVGLDTSWMPPLQRDAVQPLLNAICGLENIVVARGEGDELMRDIAEKRKGRETEIPLSNIVVLGSTETVNSSVFSDFKSTETERKAFFVEINPEDITDDISDGMIDDVAISKMLKAAVKLAFSDTKDNFIIIPNAGTGRKIGPRLWLFNPDARVLVDDIREICEVQAEKIKTAA